MALIPKILLTCAFIVLPIEIASVERFVDDHRGHASHRLLLPLWYHEKLVRARHDRDARSFPQPTTKSWSRQDLFAERSTTTIASPTLPSRHRAEQHQQQQRAHEQRPKQEKFSAVAVAEYAGTRAIAYAGYRNNHRHQPREAVTQSYQHPPATTPTTYTKHHPGRRVCTKSVPTTTVHHHRNGQFRYLNVFNIKTDVPSSFLCCPGWTQATQMSYGCNKATCPAPCLNGGVCTSPGRCTCPKGFTGSQCQTDIDECVTEKPCDQLCRNLPGTYECHCRPGFQLQKDGQSCRKNDTDDIAFEARDLEKDFHEATTTRHPSISTHDTENEVSDGDLDQDYEIILKRLTKLEKQFARGKKRDTETTEMSTKVASVIESINVMKRTVENVQHMQQEIYEMRGKLREYESEARKMQHLTNRVVELENRLRLRCRTPIPINSGAFNF
ncbi:epidermal growth factor-like protein slowdown [Ptiloglossa arizonensis]|uniref:epidermal growth factor-like protein slowdown n=1 Tax=Ptiloglossa arizonensis TaxID=3350558 RepID=UPI003FA0E8D7